MRLRPLPTMLASVLLAACSAPAPHAPPPPAVLVRTIDAAAVLPAQQVYSGEVRARIETELGFRIGGKLIERRVDVGASVAAGAPLALLDAQDVGLAQAAAQAAVSAAEADVDLARVELSRAQALQARSFLSSAALDTRRTALQAAEARLREARAHAEVAANQAAYARLAAPAAGVITAVLAEPGQVVAAGQPVFRLARPDQREVLIHVPEGRATQFAPGMAARVRAWSAPERELAGRVREFAPAADAATRSFALRVAVPGADDTLALGSTATVVFDDAAAAGAGVLLPLAAVTRRSGQPDGGTVWVVADDGVVRALAVELGAWGEAGVVVRAGLPAHARVVVAGVHKLVEGSAVRAVEEGAPVLLDVKR
ncbi:efflux RND transporter periplasmic adaptor subunit [Thauera sp.]|jgi:RND family efflux transporter MFP subunit|uniref:efflux RND transporter periplasmic adaptor subunit n=1 Tax=Thauera sp. TaxID=1905334 RepID=UPI00262A389D|nr:efflux RND transporter periplasmic adaptor subunit [Thauera sp.]